MLTASADVDVVHSDTLYDIIHNDRRLTTRNIVRWIDQVLNTVLLYHKGYTTVGEFGIDDVKLGPESLIASTKSFAENLLTALKSGQDAGSTLSYIESPSKKSKPTQDGDRSAALDFRRRLTAASGLQMGHAEQHQRRLPRGFEYQWMIKLDIRHDNNISIQ